MMDRPRADLETTPDSGTGIRLSVIIPTYNRSAMAQLAVDSVLAQEDVDGKKLEIIVVNDGSTDDTETVLRARYHANPMVRIITTSRGRVSAARNVGIQAARGELIGFLDSDDQWTPRAFATAEWVFARYPELVFVSLEGSLLAN
ncbi:MAG: glycosyltransferase family 2 protein, partial [Candidatus Micrarchaeaceae archaeon]